MERMTETQKQELIESWLNGNRFTVYKELMNKQDIAELALAFLEYSTKNELILYLQYVAEA